MKSRRAKYDRMDEPLSYASAVIGGVAFIVVSGCIALQLSEHSLVRSTGWWSFILLAACVLADCVIGYFFPHSVAIYLPVLLAGLALFVLCCWYAWTLTLADNDVPLIKGWHHALVFFAAWALWAVHTVKRLWTGRRSNSDLLNRVRS